MTAARPVRALTEGCVHPLYARGQVVAYYDRHNRPQHGEVLAIEATWRFGKDPLVTYELAHPTYRNGRFVATAQDILTPAGRAALDGTGDGR